MAALTKARSTPRWATPAGPLMSYVMLASTTIYKGANVMLDATGKAKPAAKEANAKTVGVAEETTVSTASGGERVTVRAGVHRFDNLGADAVAAAEIGDQVYVEDDQTVRKTQDANGPVAGRLWDVDDAGAWVASPFYGG